MVENGLALFPVAKTLNQATARAAECQLASYLLYFLICTLELKLVLRVIYHLNLTMTSNESPEKSPWDAETSEKFQRYVHSDLRLLLNSLVCWLATSVAMEFC